ncbi:MAG: ABC transporter permease [Alphaproteobacteria bacterium]|nr:ABC transporter permease [Alphaproteobacteria bacterium]
MATATTPSAVKSVAAGEGYWARIWRRLKAHHSGMAGLLIVLLLTGMGVSAPLIANDKPVVCSYKGELYFPAVATYVDSWVPWQSMRNELKSFEVGDGWFPMSGSYPVLEGKTWKEVADSPDMGFALWPLVRWSPTDFDESALKVKLGVDPGHPLGTDDLGRDLMSRLIHGTVVALLVGVVAMSISSVIGITLGLAAGFFGKGVDLVLSRITEIVMCFPTFFLIIAVIAFLEPSIINIMLVLGFVGWTRIFRLVRGEVLKVRSLDYIAAARSLGMKDARIMFRHVLPNAISPVFVAIAFGVANAVLAETSLSFLGFGDTSVPSWGEMVQQGRSYVNQDGFAHMTIIPGLAIFVTLTGFNLFGQGLRDAMDPKLRD